MKHSMKKIISALLLVVILALANRNAVTEVWNCSKPPVETYSDLDENVLHH